MLLGVLQEVVEGHGFDAVIFGVPASQNFTMLRGYPGFLPEYDLAARFTYVRQDGSGIGNVVACPAEPGEGASGSPAHQLL
jgi:hypothetical protein